MKIVRLTGGLGNQMFQYAFACALEQVTGDVVKLDDSYYDTEWNDGIRVDRIKRFNLSLEMATDCDFKSIFPLYGWEKSNGRLRRKLARVARGRSSKCYRETGSVKNVEELSAFDFFDGYWAYPGYVELAKERISKDFVPNYQLADSTMFVIDELQRKNSVLLGVRRGDYFENPQFGILSREFYLNAMNLMANQHQGLTFYVFSNDIAWCKEAFESSGYDVMYREDDSIADDFEELFVMAACKHAIISNSTFHWWGAYLMDNEEKTIICPKPWHANGGGERVVLDGWQRIPRLEHAGSA